MPHIDDKDAKGKSMQTWLETIIEGDSAKQAGAAPEKRALDVKKLLSSLVREFSKPEFQRALQILLINSRKISKRASARQKNVRFELCPKWASWPESDLSSAPEVLARMGILTPSAWKEIAQFVHDETVVASVSIIDELLALPPNSTLRSLSDMRGNGTDAIHKMSPFPLRTP
jgi:hypothetical protein